MKLQFKAVDNHLNLLNLYKKYFNYLVLSHNRLIQDKNFNLDKFFEGVFNLKIETSNTYKEILEKYPNEKVIIITLILFF